MRGSRYGEESKEGIEEWSAREGGMEEKGSSVETPVSFQLDGVEAGAGAWGAVSLGWGSCQQWIVGTPWVLHLNEFHLFP